MATGQQVEVMIYRSTPLRRVCENLRELITDDERDAYLRVPFLIQTAAYFECLLNEKLDAHFRSVWGAHYKSEAEPYFRLGFAEKLNQIVPLMTNNEYRINRSHAEYAKLKALISARNRAVHSKPTFDMKPAVSEHPFFRGLMLPEPDLRNVSELLGIEKDFSVDEMFLAVTRFERWFFNRCPERLSHVAIVIAKDKAPMEPQFTTWSKRL